MCDKATDTCPFVSTSVPDWYNTQEMCDKLVSEEFFMLKYCLDKHKSEKMCDKAVDACLSALQFVPDWFVPNKMLEILGQCCFLQ